ncbi:MAG: hypothetical protein ABEJ78_02775, partial [Haloferacaceae archaeon]
LNIPTLGIPPRSRGGGCQFAFACLLYSIWRAVDLLVQVELTGEYEHSPVITADNTLTLLKKETGIG